MTRAFLSEASLVSLPLGRQHNVRQVHINRLASTDVCRPDTSPSLLRLATFVPTIVTI
jgi:hypothetical protein